MGTKISDLTPNSNPNKDSEIVIAHNGQNAKVKLSELSDIVAPVQAGGGLSKNSEGALRVSSESAFFVLLVNSNGTAYENTQDMTYTPGAFHASWQIADLKFVTVRDAMHFSQNNFPSGVTVRIVMETDITETRSVSVNHYNMIEFSCNIHVYGNTWHGLYGISHADAFTAQNVGSRRTLTISGQNTQFNNMILWNSGSGTLGFVFMNFDIQDMNHNGYTFGVFRAELTGYTVFAGVKVKISGSSTFKIPRIIECRDNGTSTIRVPSAPGAGDTLIGKEVADPLLQGFGLNALELDLASYAGGFKKICDVVAGSLRINEYNAHMYGVGAEKYTFNANICFTTDAQLHGSAVVVEQNSLFEANGPCFTKASGVTIYSNFAAIDPSQYASIKFSDPLDWGDNENVTTGSVSSAGVPGNALYDTEAVAIADYVQVGSFVNTLSIATPSTK